MKANAKRLTALLKVLPLEKMEYLELSKWGINITLSASHSDILMKLLGFKFEFGERLSDKDLCILTRSNITISVKITKTVN